MREVQKFPDGEPDEHQEAVSRRRVLITGGTRGIGQAVAQALAERHHVVIGGRAARQVAEAVSAYPSAEGFVADLTDDHQVQQALEGMGEVDAVVHSAGALWRGNTEGTTRQEWTNAFALNVTAVAMLTSRLLPRLREARGDVIILNSGSGLYTYPGGAVYCASKHALTAYADVLRAEERDRGVRVTSVHPGHVDTDMQRQLRETIGGPYQAGLYLRPASVAVAVAMALDATQEADVESILIRPRTTV